MEKSGGSKLLQMQARFQQKQMQEREMKIASLYEAQQARALGRVRNSPANGAVTASSSPPPTTLSQPGKVRQMFEERRTKGIDKSYPLQPIQNTERTPPRRPLPNGYTKVTSTASRTVEKKVMKNITSTHSIRNQQKTNGHTVENMMNGSGDVNHNHDHDHNDNIKYTTASSNGKNTTEADQTDGYLIENETFPVALEPLATPRSPAPAPEPAPETRANRTRAVKTSPVRTKPQAVPPQRKVSKENNVSENSRGRAAMQRGANVVTKRSPPVAVQASGAGASRARVTGSATSAGGATSARSAGAAGGEPCAVCGRRFAADRVLKHQQICSKSLTKKRKPFDALKHRLAGTEAEPFIGKLRKGTTSSTKVNKSLNSNWRQKHEEFIQAIRAAKQVQAHLNAGGKLSDLPPPPPSENPDYVACPHCGRRFNQGAAERHIPKCASYQFNKPKPKASNTKRR